MEPYSTQRRGSRKFTARPETERREPDRAGQNRGGLLQRGSSALGQNATGTVNQNGTERLFAWNRRRSPRSQHRS
jgi:hypothetical protein